MPTTFDPVRYELLTKKNPREIVMLRGSGCQWRRCTFCDYHLDYSRDEASNFELNKNILAHVTGQYHDLEVINSGSFNELDVQTISLIETICVEKNIHDLHFEMHWMHRESIPALRSRFAALGIRVHVKMGVETFDAAFRDNMLKKGMDHVTPEEIAPYADDVCLLFGLTGQTLASMQHDIETGLAYFDRICINIMTPNTTKVQPDPAVIAMFKEHLYAAYIKNPRVDILLQNTDFGVGGEQHA